MNINEIAYMYNSALNNTALGATESATYEKQIAAAKEALEKAGVSGFSGSLEEEVSKLTDEESKRATEFKALASALDHSVLGDMVEGATEKDLALMSEEMLGTSKGREVLSKLMEGHFNNMVLGGKDDHDNDNENSLTSIDNSLNPIIEGTS
ncbi:MAG: hypothetical protein K5669_11740 [Lachnospiraceae bacterium]|nr:hypothetical protein [Lachnospiraceae bacterium]